MRGETVLEANNARQHACFQDLLSLYTQRLSTARTRKHPRAILQCMENAQLEARHSKHSNAKFLLSRRHHHLFNVEKYQGFEHTQHHRIRRAQEDRVSEDRVQEDKQ